jgi:hypothetical protein
MIRKLLLTGVLAGTALLGVSVIAQQDPQQTQPQAQPEQQTQQAAKSVTGKVAAIGNGGHSFTLQVSQSGSDKGSMDFVLDNKTQVQGQVRVGTPVTVVYQIAQGQNIAVSISAQG